MILDLVWQLVSFFIEPAINALPDGELNVPVLDSVFSVLGKVNSVIPIAGPMLAAVTALSALVVFIGLRWILVMWRQVPFT